MLDVVVAIIAILGSFIALEKCTDYFVSGLSSIAKKHGIPQTVIGATVAAIGSSMPEFSTSAFSVLESEPSIGIGTIVGSAIFNILVIIGVAAYVRRCELGREVFYRDGLVYLLTVGLLTALVIHDGELSRWEALGMVIVYCIYFGWLMRDAKKHKQDYTAKEKEIPPEDRIEILDTKTTMKYLTIGMVVIVTTAYLIVRSAIIITDAFGIGTGVFSLIVIAAGSSIPDLFTSVQAARKGMGGLAISNAIGSNTFDILVCIGGPMAFRATTQIGTQSSTGISVFFLFSSVILTLLLIRRRWSIGKKEALALLGLYAAYVAALIVGEIV